MDVENMSLKNIGQNIKHFRKLRRLSQQKVAESANIAQSYYKSIESQSKESPSLETLMKICMVLDVPLDFIVKDCGIQLFEDYTNSLLIESIKNLDEQEKKVFSKVLFSVYSAVIESNQPDDE